MVLLNEKLNRSVLQVWLSGVPSALLWKHHLSNLYVLEHLVMKENKLFWASLKSRPLTFSPLSNLISLSVRAMFANAFRRNNLEIMVLFIN